MNDELMLLWQQGMEARPDPAEVARLAGLATVNRFDRVIGRRNLKEYAASILVLAGCAGLLVFTQERVLPLLTIAGVVFVVLYLWKAHRNLKPLDPASDARSYQAAMLARIDQQMRLLSTVRYWYLLPLYIPALWQVVSTWPRSPGAAIVVFVTVTGTFAWVARLNERVGIARLRAEREKVEGLYEEEA